LNDALPLGEKVGNAITNNPYVVYSFNVVVEIVGHSNI